MIRYLPKSLDDKLLSMSNPDEWCRHNCSDYIIPELGAPIDCIYEKGYQMAVESAKTGKPVFRWDGKRENFFFLATEEELVEKLKK